MMYKSNKQIKNALNNNRIAVILIKSSKCNVCIPISDKVSELSKNYANVLWANIYVEEVAEFCAQNLVFTVPTILIFHNNKEVFRQSRFIDIKKIQCQIDKLI